MAAKYQLVSIYLSEADQWHGRPLHLEILQFLQRSGCAGGTVLRAVAGFTAAAGVVTTSLVDVGSKLPLVVHFVDRAEKVAEVLPRLREMAGKRLVTLEEVEVVPPPA
jgi:PII-like signaling protein